MGCYDFKNKHHNDSSPVFKINKLQLNSTTTTTTTTTTKKDETLSNLSVKKRYEIRWKLILAERYGTKMAHKIYPIKIVCTQKYVFPEGKLIQKWQLVKGNYQRI